MDKDAEALDKAQALAEDPDQAEDPAIVKNLLDALRNAPRLDIVASDGKAEVSEGGCQFLQSLAPTMKAALHGVTQINFSQRTKDDLQILENACGDLIEKKMPGRDVKECIQYLIALSEIITSFTSTIQREEEYREKVSHLPYCSADPGSFIVPIGTFSRAVRTGVGGKEYDTDKGVKAENTEGTKLEQVKRPLIGTGPANLVISDVGKKRLTDYFEAMWDGGDHPSKVLVESGYLEPRQYMVYCAVCSLYKYLHEDRNMQEPVIWPGLIYQVMPGSRARMTEGEELEIRRTIEMFSQLKLDVGVHEDYRANAYLELLPGVMVDYMIRRSPALEIDETFAKLSNGVCVDGYTVKREPLLFTLDKCHEQYLSIDAEDLHGYPLDMRGGRQLLLFFVISYIYGTKRAWAEYKRQHYREEQKKAGNKGKPRSALPAPSPLSLPRMYSFISWDRLYNDAGIQATNRTVLKRYRDFCEAVLAEQVKRGKIKGYKMENNGPGKKATGFLIIPND